MDSKDMRKAGNAAIDEKDYEKAIQLYSDALLVKDIPDEEKGILHSNRSYANLMSALQSDDSTVKFELALQDANDAIQVRPTWWKGYFRAAEIYKFQNEWNLAIDLYDQAIALNPDLVEAKNSRDGCHLGNIQAEINRNSMPHGLKEEIEHLNRLYESTVEAEYIIHQNEELMKSINPEHRAEACVFFGVRYVKGVHVPQDIKKGLELLQEAVDIGSPEAMVELGILYMEGKTVNPNIAEAVSLFEQAAQCDPKTENSLEGEHDGITQAQFHVGLCFDNGTGKPVDHFEARGWYEKASERGHAGAANNQAILYEKGDGGNKCSVRAKQLFCLSASRGNALAMESLAWKYLEEKELNQAEIWYLRALEAENHHSIQNKDTFFKVLEETRNYIKLMEAQVQPFEASGAAAESVMEDNRSFDMANLVEAIERVTTNKPSITKVLPIGDSPFAKYWADFDEIEKRAKDGYPFARTLILSMSYFTEGTTHLNNLCTKKMNPKDIASTQEQCIYNFANCFRATEIIACFDPSELPPFMKICKAKISKQKSDLDLAARVVYCFLLTVTHNAEMFSFSRICCQLYPEEVFFYKMHAGAYAVKQDFEGSKKVLDEGLERFPTNECLLYCKAGAMKMIESYRSEEIVAAYNEFIKHAPYDERLIPEAYYNIAFYLSDEAKKIYFKRGQEAELKMLPCLLPYQSNIKNLLEAMMIFESTGQSSNTAKATESMLTSLGAPTKFQLTNRIQFVQRHRQMLKNTSELCHSKNFIARMSLKVDTLSMLPIDCKEITFIDMHPDKDEVYMNRYINLLVSEDPMFGLYTAIHVIVHDDNGDCLNCSFYDLDHFDEDVRRNLCFGSKITILNPFYRLASDGSIALRVDDSKTIIYHSSGKDNPICRYCFKENPQHSCGNCKRAKYCCRSCQTDDWKSLKHKLICGLKYFDDM